MAVASRTSESFLQEKMETSEQSNSSHDDDDDVSSEIETETTSESEEANESNEDESESEKINNHKSKEIFKLYCLDKLNDNTRQDLFSSWSEDGQDLYAMSKLHVKELSGNAFDKDFTPWWDADSAKKRKVEMEMSNHSITEYAPFNNWFSKSSNDSSIWLSGPSSSCNLVQKESAPVEDIYVPSIYDKKPKPKGRRAMKRDRKAAREQTTGKKWYDMKLPDVDSKMRMDMDIIRMRSVLDPKRFYKHNDRKGLPKYFQMGTVVDEGTDFYSSRLTKKQRKQTLVEELMADSDIRQYNKRKYAELQHKQRGKKFKTKKK